MASSVVAGRAASTRASRRFAMSRTKLEFIIARAWVGTVVFPRSPMLWVGSGASNIVMIGTSSLRFTRR